VWYASTPRRVSRPPRSTSCRGPCAGVGWGARVRRVCPAHACMRVWGWGRPGARAGPGAAVRSPPWAGIWPTHTSPLHQQWTLTHHPPHQRSPPPSIRARRGPQLQALQEGQQREHARRAGPPRSAAARPPLQPHQAGASGRFPQDRRLQRPHAVCALLLPSRTSHLLHCPCSGSEYAVVWWCSGQGGDVWRWR